MDIVKLTELRQWELILATYLAPWSIRGSWWLETPSASYSSLSNPGSLSLPDLLFSFALWISPWKLNFLIWFQVNFITFLLCGLRRTFPILPFNLSNFRIRKCFIYLHVLSQMSSSFHELGVLHKHNLCALWRPVLVLAEPLKKLRFSNEQLYVWAGSLWGHS